MIYVSANNPGAYGLARVLKAGMGQSIKITTKASLSNATTPQPWLQEKTRTPRTLQTPRFRAQQTPRFRPGGGRATHFVLYLNRQTFVGAAGVRLADELRAARAAGFRVVMVHENASERDGCAFSHFFGTTPDDLIKGGLFNDLAVALYSGDFQPTSVALVAQKLGAVNAGRRAQGGFTTADAAVAAANAWEVSATGAAAGNMEGIEEAADIAPRPKHRRHGQSWALRKQRLPLRLRTEKPTSESPVTSHFCAPATTSPIPVEWFLTNSNVDAAAEFTVRLVRDGSGRLGLGLNEANFITELSEAARANGLALLDQVCSVDGVQLGSQKLGSLLAQFAPKHRHELSIRRMPPERRHALEVAWRQSKEATRSEQYPLPGSFSTGRLWGESPAPVQHCVQCTKAARSKASSRGVHRQNSLVSTQL